ncbi:MAG: ATP-binding cassette domain-containing protein [Acidimicrobiia bacterium]
MERLAHHLEAGGIGPLERAAAVVEAETHVRDAGLSALEVFGTPLEYAEELVAALAPSRASLPGSQPVVLHAAGVTKAHGRRRVLHGVDLTLRAGEMVALVGMNGAGKSTLLRILAGLEQPDRGVVERHRTVGYAPQEGGLDPYLRPDEHFTLFGTAAGLSPAEAVRSGRRLAGELGWATAHAPVAGRLSGGTRQKLSVIVALLGSPGVLLLDEPYQGMDDAGSARFWELLWSLGQQGTAAVVSAHGDEVLRHTHRALELGEEVAHEGG